MTLKLFEQFANDCFIAQPCDSQSRKHPRVFRRVFRLVCSELPGYQQDLVDDEYTVVQAKARLRARVEARYRSKWPVHDQVPRGWGRATDDCGFVFITLAIVLTAILVAVVEWAVFWLLDHIIHVNGLLALKAEAESQLDQE